MDPRQRPLDKRMAKHAAEPWRRACLGKPHETPEGGCGAADVNDSARFVRLIIPRMRDHRFKSCPRNQFLLVINNLRRWIPAAYLLFWHDSCPGRILGRTLVHSGALGRVSK